MTTRAVLGARRSRSLTTSGGAWLIAARWIGRFFEASKLWHSAAVAIVDPDRCARRGF